MSEPESSPLREPIEDLARAFGRIEVVANTQRGEVESVDTRALEAEGNLTSVGDTWLRQQIRHGNQLHYVRLVMLSFLILLVLLWLASIPTLLLIAGTHWNDFEISDTVLVVYIGATTINVLGLLKIATKWLFADKTPQADTGMLDTIKGFLEK